LIVHVIANFHHSFMFVELSGNTGHRYLNLFV